MNRAAAVKTLAALRVAVGGGSWLTPRAAGRLFGIDAEANPQAPYVTRLFGVRDIALAVGTAQSAGDAQRLWLHLGLACDVADAVAGVVAGRAGYLPPRAAILATGAALTGVALGAMALADD